MTSESSSDQRGQAPGSAYAVVVRGFRLSPALTDGLWLTLALSVLSTAGGTVVPLLVRHVMDTALVGDISVGAVGRWVGLAAVLVALVAVTGYWSKVRIFTATEHGLAQLRVHAFRHVHDLSMLTQNTQRRGALVSRVSSDVDQVSLFLQSSGMIMITSIGQMLVATIAMAVMCWQLTLVVLVAFTPLWLSLRYLAAMMARAYDRVRASVGEMLAVIAEPVVGAAVVRSYGIEERTQRRIDEAVGRNYRENVIAQTITAGTYSSAVLVGGIANAAVVGVGVWLGVGGRLSAGTVIAFIFLVSLFTGPAQMATQVIAEAQNAISSWRRVIELLDTPADVVDPGSAGADLPPGALDVEFDHVEFAYPGGGVVLHDLTELTIPARQRVAVVGETGSGKTTFAKLLTRLMDPTAGVVRLGGVDVSQVAFSHLRRHVLMVPQEGFLFDATLAENLRYGRRDATDAELLDAVERLELREWFDTLPQGLATRVGQRGESLSAGERQLVALVRTALADPALVVLDEATSAVDPRTELRATRALERLLAGRTSVTIAHRLSTAENADRVLVFDAGRLVEDGRHAALVEENGVYARLHASWVAQAQLGVDGRIDG